MRNSVFPLLCSALVCAACATTSESEDPGQRIANQALIIDTHIDVPYRLFLNTEDVSQTTTQGQFDFPRATAGGLNAAFMSIYIPALVDETGHAYSFAESNIDRVVRLTADHPDKFALATCVADLAIQQAQGVVSLPMGMENGGPIASKIKNLEHFYHRGIRYITLAHSKSNHISDSSYDTNERWQGLSDFGKTLIPAMNQLGVMIDVSHISDAAFWQVMTLSKVPVIASHSSLRHFTPDFHRNMDDNMVKALAAQGGVIQINFGSSFLTRAAREYSDARTAAVRAFQQANNLPDRAPALQIVMREYTRDNPYPYADLSDVLDHIDRVVELTSIDAVGIGSDYDGVGDTLPNGLKDVSSYPNLVNGLIMRGYSENEIRKILGGNLRRVWQAAEAYAGARGNPPRCTWAP